MGLKIVGGNYVELGGVAGGQVIIGGTEAGDDITFQTTSHGTKGSYIFSEMTSAGFVKNNASGVVTGGNAIIDADVPNTITLNNITQITARSHTNLSDIGTNTHAQIDTHIADTNDDHTRYVQLAGRSGGQTIIGGTDASDNLTLQSTSHATKGKIFFSNTTTGVHDIAGIMYKGTIGSGGRFGFYQDAGAILNKIESIIDASGEVSLRFYDMHGGSVIEVMRLDGGGVCIGGAAPATSAILDLTSITKALLLSRMTTAQRNALTAVNGMVIYNITTPAFNFYENGAWVTK